MYGIRMTFTTATETDPVADLAAWLGEQTWSTFAQSLARDFARYGRLTERQVSAATSMRAKCEARQQRQERHAAPELPDVAAGYYAVESLSGNNDLDFFRVDRPTEGRWAGYTFVKRVIGGRPDVAVRGAQARKALDAILSAGTREAAIRYGQEIGRCGVCNRHLTDEESRAFGIGPHCRAAF